MSWPRLSETLPHAEPMKCAGCGVDYETSERDLELWQEHDDRDRPEPIFFWLCTRCSSRIIEPHPRLYRNIGENHPAPGAQRMCADCKHRVRTRCRCPKARANGGDGILLKGGSGFHGMIDGRNYRGPFHHWSSPPNDCTGKET